MPTEKENTGRWSNISHSLRALRGRNFALFLSGQSVSVIGTWMQGTALSWLVYRMTGSEVMLGVVAFASQISSFLVSPIAGVLTDRWNRHRMVIITQALAMAQAAMLAALALTGTIQVWHIIALALMGGFINAIDVPNRQSFVVHMVARREDLPNAIALNSFVFNAGRLVGPPLAGLIIWAVNSLAPHHASHAGEGVCFLINAISYGAVVLALMAMRINAPPRAERHNHVLHDLREGFRYSFGFMPIRAVLLLLATVGLITMPYGTLIPVFAKDILKGNSFTQGIILASGGVGALTAALYMASRRSVRGLGRLLAVAPFIVGAGLIAFGASHWLALSLPMMAVIGFGMMMHMASSNTILQTIVDDDKRGRVMSFYTIAFMGTVPFGSLVYGFLAARIGAQWTLIIAGAASMVASAVFATRLPALRRLVRPIYVRMGIISETGDIPKSVAQADIEPSAKK